MHVAREDLCCVTCWLKASQIKAFMQRLMGKMDSVPLFPFLFQWARGNDFPCMCFSSKPNFLEVRKYYERNKWRQRGVLSPRKKGKTWSVICPCESVKAKSYLYVDHCSQEASPRWVFLFAKDWVTSVNWFLVFEHILKEKKYLSKCSSDQKLWFCPTSFIIFVLCLEELELIFLEVFFCFTLL